MIRSRKEILEEIKKLSDEDYKVFHSSLCPKNDNILGVRVPKLRKYTKELIDEDWKETYNNIGNEYYEEILLQGMILGIVKINIEDRLKYLEGFIPKINNWAICDITCAGLKFTKKNQEKVFKFLAKYLKSDEEFELRFAIVMLLNYYINDKYVNEVIKILDCIKHKEYYYAKMAIAWTLSMIYIKYPNIGENYLKSNNNLDNDTYNKTLQKIIESNRIEKREKNRIKKMKRRI